MSTTDNYMPSGLAPLALPPTVSPPEAASEPAPTRTVRVLHIINGEHFAGAERVQDLLAKCLPEYGYSAGFACLKLDKFFTMRQTREAPLFDVQMRTRLDPRAARQVARIAREGDYRILHAHTVRSLLVGRLVSSLTGLPLVYHIHSPTSRDTAHRWRNLLNDFVEHRSLRHVSHVIAVSRAMAEHIAGKGIDSTRITVVPNGVPRLDALPPRRTPHGVWTLGAAALFRPRKGLEVLIGAMARLHRDGIHVMLRAVGEFESHEYETEIVKLLHRLGMTEHVMLRGFARDVTDELRKMDLLVLPSLYGEGLPMVVLEAMAAGAPVVASRVPGISEVIRHGRDGVLVDPADPDALAKAIAAIVDGKYNWSAMRASAYLRQSVLFSDRTMAEGVAGVYNHVLEEQRRNKDVY